MHLTVETHATSTTSHQCDNLLLFDRWLRVLFLPLFILCLGRVSTTAQTPNDELVSRQTFVRRIQLDQAWRVVDALPQPAQPMTIAVIAQGFDLTHPDLQGVWFTNTADPINGRDDDNNGFIDDNQGWDFVGNPSSVLISQGYTEEDNIVQSRTATSARTGTHIAGIIGALRNNGIGIAGIARNIRILPIRIGTDDSTQQAVGRLADAIRYATMMGAKIIVLTTSTTDRAFSAYRAQEQEAINTAVRQGALVLVPVPLVSQTEPISTLLFDETTFPAGYDNVVAVSAIGDDNTRLATTRAGNRTTIYAPGETLFSTLPNNQYGSITGSEQAVGVVAGVSALIWQANPTWTPQQVTQQLRSAADNTWIGTQTGRSALGYGQVNALRSVTANRTGGTSIPALGLSDVIQFSLADNVQGNPLTAISNTNVARLAVRIKNYQSAVANVTVQILPVGDSALIVPVDASVIRTIASLPSQQTRNAEFLVQLTPRAFQSGLLQGDVLVVIRAGDYVQYVPLRIPISASLDGARGLLVASRIDLGVTATNENLSRVVQLLNPTTVVQTINTITLAGAQAGEFSITQLPRLPLELQPGSTQTCTVVFRTTSSTVLGLRQAVLNIRGADSLYSTAIVATRGLMRIPLEFRAYNINDVTVVPVGNSTTWATSILIRAIPMATTVTLSIDSSSVDAGDFSFGSGFSRTAQLFPNGSVIDCPIIFSPRTEGPKQLVIRLRSVGMADTLVYFTRGVGIQANADGVVISGLTRTQPSNLSVIRQIRESDILSGGIRVLNASTSSVTISGVSFTGLGAGDCGVVTTGTGVVALPTTLSPGQSVSIFFTGAPSRVGETYTRVRLNYTTSTSTVPISIPAGIIVGQAPTGRLFTTQLRTFDQIVSAGSGLMYPSLVPVFPDRNTGYQLFFQARVGVQTTDNIVLTNPTQASANVTSLTFSDPNYRVVSALPKTLAAGRSDTITIRYTPSSSVFAPVRVQAELQVAGGTTIRDTALIQPSVVPTSYISANGSGQNLMTLFATTMIGDTAFALTAPNITNNGTSALQVNTVVVGTHADEFQVLGLAQSRSGTLSVGTSDSLVVRFLPRTAGIKTAVIIVQAGSSTLRYQIVARAIERPILTLQESAVNLGSIGDGEEFVRAIALTGRNLTNNIVVNVSGHPALFSQLNDSTRFLRSYQVQPNDDGTLNDSLRILAAPLIQPDTLLGSVQVVSGTALAQTAVSATARPTLLPRIRTIDQLTYDTVFTEIGSVRTLSVNAVNLVQDIFISFPAGITIEANGFLLSRSGRIPRSTFDSLWNVRWVPPRLSLAQLQTLSAQNTVIPYRDSIRITSGTVQRIIPIVGAITPSPEIAVDRLVTFNAIQQGEVITTTITVSAVQVATGASMQLLMSPEDTDSIRVMKFVVRDVRGRVQLLDTMMITLPQGATFFTTTITVQYAPVDAGQKTGVVVLQVPSVNGDTLSTSIAVLGTALPRPRMIATTQGIEFGTVQVFSNTPRISDLVMSSVRDTVRWRIVGGELSPFSVEVANQRYLKSGAFIPNEINRVDTNIVIWFEPLEQNRYVDTLRFMSSDFGVYDIILGGSSSTVTSISYRQGVRGVVQIVPTEVDDAMYLIVNDALGGESSIELYTILGQRIGRCTMRNLSPGRYAVPIRLQNITHGIIQWRLLHQGTVYTGSILKR